MSSSTEQLTSTKRWQWPTTRNAAVTESVALWRPCWCQKKLQHQYNPGADQQQLEQQIYLRRVVGGVPRKRHHTPNQSQNKQTIKNAGSVSRRRNRQHRRRTPPSAPAYASRSDHVRGQARKERHERQPSASHDETAGTCPRETSPRGSTRARPTRAGGP